MKRAGAQAFFVTGNDSYVGNGNFSKAWTIDQVSQVNDFILTGPIHADVVFDKGGFEGTDIKVVTDHRLHPILNDKVLTYQKFERYQPKSVTCHSIEEVSQAINAMTGEMVVVKNPYGSGGSQVYIDLKEKIQIPVNETFPLIVQEFIDMSGGIEGLAAGIHDLRVLVAGGTVLGATIREPAKGKLHANVSLGGSEKLIHKTAIPQEVLDIVQDVDSQLESLPRYYAIDFAKGKQGWLMVELNNKPGLFRESTGELARSFMSGLADYLVSLA